MKLEINELPIYLVAALIEYLDKKGELSMDEIAQLDDLKARMADIVEAMMA